MCSGGQLWRAIVAGNCGGQSSLIVEAKENEDRPRVCKHTVPAEQQAKMFIALTKETCRLISSHVHVHVDIINQQRMPSLVEVRWSIAMYIYMYLRTFAVASPK